MFNSESIDIESVLLTECSDLVVVKLLLGSVCSLSQQQKTQPSGHPAVSG
jgi:hypothetical protein